MTTLANRYVPSVWIDGLIEAQASFPGIINSGLFSADNKLFEFANGEANSAELVLERDITGQADGVQGEGSAPGTSQLISSVAQVCVALNRETKNTLTAFAKDLGAGDPLASFFRQVAMRNDMQTAASTVAILRGISSVAAIAAVLTESHFHEAAADVDADTDMINADMIIDARARLGEIPIEGSVLFMHPKIHAALLKEDDNAWTRVSENGLTLEYYKGMRVFQSNSLVRAGAGAGAPPVYDTYLALPGSFGYGNKTQEIGDIGNPVIGVATFNVAADVDKNILSLYDRHRKAIHPFGGSWKGTPAGSTPTNAELALGTNWESKYTSNLERHGIARILTNG